MKFKKIKFLLFLLCFLALPSSVFAISYKSEIDVTSLININAIIQSGAVVNDTTNATNLNYIIMGMIVIILIIIGVMLFPKKK